MPRLKKEDKAKKIASETYDFLNKELISYIKKKKYEEDGDAIFAISCATAAFAADLLNKATELDSQDIFAYITDAVAGALNIELEYLQDDQEAPDEEDSEPELTERTIDKKLLN